MASHKVTAVFATRAEAERVARILVSELNIPYAAVDVNPLGREPPVGYDTSNLWDAAAIEPKGLMFVTQDERQAYLDALRHGRMQVTAMVPESEVAHAAHLLEHSGALDLYDDEHDLKREHEEHEHLVHSGEPVLAATSPVVATVSESADVVRARPVASVTAERPGVGTSETSRRHSRVRSYPVEHSESAHHEEAVQGLLNRTGVEVDRLGQPQPKV